ncbi:ADM_HP2_G0000960.mRNA.1.CDS.1 [Saccharomyces cerevisiae]|nr:ADM_HP2_G0000960.mRNA.1.CDS.1 [Saccharomyces cerevisiae]CAI6457706.1 ADM_HP2_G0000960.mRNA.1.CDS.1 [Saccharomyces cerevisiae]
MNGTCSAVQVILVMDYADSGQIVQNIGTVWVKLNREPFGPGPHFPFSSFTEALNTLAPTGSDDVIAWSRLIISFQVLAVGETDQFIFGEDVTDVTVTSSVLFHMHTMQKVFASLKSDDSNPLFSLF